jgi:hypothetical protein
MDASMPAFGVVRVLLLKTARITTAGRPGHSSVKKTRGAGVEARRQPWRGAG